MNLLEKLEHERRKRNELGLLSLEQRIPLGSNPKVQEQSRKVDELMIRYQKKGAKRKP